MKNTRQALTPQMVYLSSLEAVDRIQETIVLDEQYIDSLVNRDTGSLILVDDAGFEVKRFEFGVDDMERLASARGRIKENRERLTHVAQSLKELVAQNPELEEGASAPVDYSVPGQVFTIWAEGYLASGDRGDATFMGSVKANSFDEAVRTLVGKNPDEAHLYQQHTDGHWTFWACRLFDNEAAARVNFG